MSNMGFLSLCGVIKMVSVICSMELSGFFGFFMRKERFWLGVFGIWEFAMKRQENILKKTLVLKYWKNEEKIEII